MTQVKICGLKTAPMVQAAIQAGADYIGFVFVERSPRFIDLPAARTLIDLARAQGVQTVGLWQGQGSIPLAEIVASGVDIVQAHGTDPGALDLPVWYAMGVSQAADLPTKTLPGGGQAYDRLLFDAKPPKDSVIEGGHGQQFDWTLLASYQACQPWMLAGGLSPDNVAQAIAISGANAVDVSSGVERAKGEKDASLIQGFIRAAKQASG